MTRVLLLDNNDSFTYNLAELLRNNGKVTFNIFTAETLSFAKVPDYDKIILSPGPGIPGEHPAIFEILAHYAAVKGILGVCLGHQAIAIHFGASLVNLDNVRHGEVVNVNVLSQSCILFAGLPGKFEAGLYHSWAVNGDDIPNCLDVTAVSEEGTIMGLAHKTLDICSVQFHPESIMTRYGQQMMDNWIGL